MRILFGVVGEGMGHATRSKVSIEWLLHRGHQVLIVASGRAYSFLKQSFSARFCRYADVMPEEPSCDIVEIQGLTMKYVNNAFDEVGSVVQNVLRAPGMLLENVGAYYEDVVRFQPQVVISDFDSFAYVFAKVHKLPILSIDNQHILYRCEIPKPIKNLDISSYRTARTFIKTKMPRCNHYLITSFFYPKVRDKFASTTTLIPPILRQAILEAKVSPALESKHFLVYQTSQSDATLIPTLNAWGVPCIVYGLGRDEQIKNCTLKSFSEKGFVHDLAQARGVIANGGLSLINEAISLHKPVFSVPVQNSFEQLINAAYIKELGYGSFSSTIDVSSLHNFSKRLPIFAQNIDEFKHDSNAMLYHYLDETLEHFEGQVFHKELRKLELKKPKRTRYSAV